MVKGWRNDPRWVDLYMRKKEAMERSRLDLMQAQFHIDQAIADRERFSRILNRKELKVTAI